jgi:hypothetical protein
MDVAGRLLSRCYSAKDEVRKRDRAPTRALLVLEAEVFHSRQTDDLILDLSYLIQVGLGEDIRTSR